MYHATHAWYTVTCFFVISLPSQTATRLSLFQDKQDYTGQGWGQQSRTFLDIWKLNCIITLNIFSPGNSSYMASLQSCIGYSASSNWCLCLLQFPSPYLLLCGNTLHKTKRPSRPYTIRIVCTRSTRITSGTTKKQAFIVFERILEIVYIYSLQSQ